MLKRTLMAGAALLLSAPLAMNAVAQQAPQNAPTDRTAPSAAPADRTAPSTAPMDRATPSNTAPDATKPSTATPRTTLPADRAQLPKKNPALTKTGFMSANAIIGADVRNKSDESIGTVQDVFVSKDGAIKGVVVGVGGFLGVGKHEVMLSWDKVQLREDSDHDGLVIMTDATKESLKAMPDVQQSQLQ
jgi:sporulation protein YlmC with PRC-barrel domain